MPAATPQVASKENLAALKAKIAMYSIAEERERCAENLRDFVEAAWPYIDASPFQGCWAIDAMCLPYNTKIITSDGEKAIGKIVQSKWQGNILSFNHKTLEHQWKPIVAHMQSAGKPLLIINNNLKLTDNHPIYILGRGYIRADQVKVGDVIGTGLRGSATANLNQMSELWKAELCAALPKKRARFLFNEMLQCIQSSPRKRNMSWLWQVQRSKSRVLQSLLGQITAARKIASLHSMWERGLEVTRRVLTSAKSARRILQSKMLWFSNSGREAPSICGWNQYTGVSNRVSCCATLGKEAGSSFLFPMQKENKIGYPSYRSEQDQQRDIKSSDAMSYLSPSAASSLEMETELGSQYQIGTTIVNSIERDIWVPDTVYNIEVLDNHNYFANSILVHNCDHLEAVTIGTIPRLLINIPPRCAKTKTVSVIYPAWVWARRGKLIGKLSGPQVKFLCASYSDKLTLDSSNEFRRLVQSDWYQARWPLKFMLDQNTKGHMDNDQGGSRKSTSVGGSLLGMGGDILIGDDLNNTEKSTDKSISETGAERAASANFWSEFRSTRRNDPREGHNAVINVQQRVHEEDVSGNWLDSEEEVIHLMIPMRHDPTRHCKTIVLPQYDDDTPWEDPRDPNGEELMWPERFGEFEVHGLEKALGPYMAAGRLQQRPTPKGGGIIQRAWWQLWDEKEAARYGLEWAAGRREFPHFELVVASLDTAYKEKEENDFNAFTIWGIFLDRARNRRAMLMYAWQKRLPLNGKVISALPGELPVAFKQRNQEAWGLVDWIADGCKRYKVKRLLIEDKSRGHDVANEIRRLYQRENWGVQLINPVGDKISRAHSIVPLFTDNCIWAPDTKWAELTITDCERFPKGAHDDLTDSTTQFLNWARELELLVLADEMSAANEEAAMFKHKTQSVSEQYGV